MIRAGIMGAAGYTGGELLRLLEAHPEVDIAWAHSRSQAGRPIAEVHADWWSVRTTRFVGTVDPAIDGLFLCVPHGESAAILAEGSWPATLKIIDLSNTFRLAAHAGDFVYGLPELRAEQIAKSQRVANPGCFATAIQLALLPLAAAGWIKEDVHIHALTGSTGAGQQSRPTTHFSWRDNNLSVYKAFQHQHLDEIYQSLRQVAPDYTGRLNFLPLRGNFSRGIFASHYTTVHEDLATIRAQYQDFYRDQPFVQISTRNPSLKQVINTNRCILYLEKHDDRLLLISIIDNLLKGASGQAVQNMNLQFGWAPSLGLQLKASVF